MLTSVDLKRKAILAFTGVNLAVNLALSVLFTVSHNF